MKFSIDHDLHIHSNISKCSGDPEQTPERILRYAQENGLYPFHITHAPIRKGKNIEYLLHLKTTKHQAMTDDTVIQTVKNLVKIHSTKQ